MPCRLKKSANCASRRFCCGKDSNISEFCHLSVPTMNTQVLCGCQSRSQAEADAEKSAIARMVEEKTAKRVIFRRVKLFMNPSCKHDLGRPGRVLNRGESVSTAQMRDKWKLVSD